MRFVINNKNVFRIQTPSITLAACNPDFRYHREWPRLEVLVHSTVYSLYLVDLRRYVYSAQWIHVRA